MLTRFQGVKFEPNSFKLNHEMVVLMGGRYSQGYQLFQNLTVKAFLAIRPHAEQLISTVQLMLDTGLPSFKGEPTIKRLRDRFALGLTERQAAEFMMATVKNAHENVRSTAYDEFQRLQNEYLSFDQLSADQIMSVPLPTLFSRGLSSASKASSLPTVDDETQELVQSSLKDLTALGSRIAGLSLFSPNETIEDISTTDLIYLLVPYTISEVRGRVRTSDREERIVVLEQTQKDLRNFLSYLENYEIVPEEERALYDRRSSAIADPTKRRELKIKQFQKEKELNARIQTLRKRRGQSSPSDATPNDFDLITSLLPSKSSGSSIGDEDDDIDSETDEILREATLLLLRLKYAHSHSQLDSMNQELELLASAPPAPPRQIRQEVDRRGKARETDSDIPASEAAPTSSEQLALDAEMDGTLDGEEKAEMKRLKDENWARFTDENPKGAGNTMNRG
ncbi:hypothetical protein H0H92_007375 [Tricholoma furcatifolium]|nr:hypothetical protein H0H92_007375 [Tricholoma furcatifolium]